MIIRQITAVVFSPAGHTRRCVESIAAAFSAPCRWIDCSGPDEDSNGHLFQAEELVLFGAPVFGGRIPAPAAERFARCRAAGSPAIAVVTYGNRAYEDALLELQALTQRGGFHVVGAAALVAQHSMVPAIAAERPDACDQMETALFARRVEEKLLSCDTAANVPALTVPGNEPYRDFHGVPLQPRAGRRCVRCGLCSDACPVGAIPHDDPRSTDKTRCITCMRCVNVCPHGARALPRLPLLAAAGRLRKACAGVRANALFV